LIFSLQKCLSILQTNKSKPSALHVDGSDIDIGVQAYKYILILKYISGECSSDCNFLLWRGSIEENYVSATQRVNYATGQ
jgi:hypothetical protein